MTVTLFPPRNRNETRARLAALAILGVLFLFLMGFGLMAAQSEASLYTARKADAQTSAIQESSRKILDQLNAEITKRDGLIAELNDRLGKAV